jgi:hypothetical protein
MSRKTLPMAISSAVAIGAVIVTLPSAHAAPEKTPDEIMRMCEAARVVNGEPQTIEDFQNRVGFLASSCDFVETDFKVFWGETKLLGAEVPNCEPNATKPLVKEVGGTDSVGQGQGKYTATQTGGGGGLLGILSLAWQKHRGTTELTTEYVESGSTHTETIPVGKVLQMTVTPRMQRMTGVWKVRRDAVEGSVVSSPEENYEAEEVVEGPHVLPSAQGAPGRVMTKTKPVVRDCGPEDTP